MKLLIPIVAAVTMAEEQATEALPANPVDFVDQAFNVRPIVNKWKPVNNLDQVQYINTVDIAEKQPIKYYTGAQYNNGYYGYDGYNRYNAYNPNVVRYNTGYNNGYNTVYNTAYKNRVPYMQNLYSQYKPVEKIVEKVVQKVEDIKHHIADHREEITEDVQLPTYGKPYGKPFFGKPEIKETQGKYSSVTGKYYTPYQNTVKVVDPEEYKRPIINGFYNYVQRPVQQVAQQVARPIQYIQQQVKRPVRYVQQQNDQDWFNTFLTYYALTKDDDSTP